MLVNKQEHLLWLTSIAPNLLKSVAINPNYLTFVDLSRHIDFLKKNHQKSHAFELAFWTRIVNPLVILMMLLLSAPFIISVKRGVSVGERMMIGIVIGMGFNIVDEVVGHLGLIYDLNPPLIAFTPSLTMLMLGLYSVKRMRN
jgi:lipopolysaccharide export system permease protein